MSRTLTRLRKIVREDAKKLGHDVGCLRKVNDREYIIACINCGLYATIFTSGEGVDISDIDPNTSITKDKNFRFKYKDFRYNMYYGDCVYKSGRTLSEVHPPRSKGTIRGRLLSEKCKHNIEQNINKCPVP